MKALLYLLLFALGASCFWFLGDFAIQGGDWPEYLERREYGQPRPICHIREPGAVAIWQALAWLYHDHSSDELGRREEAKIANYTQRGERVKPEALAGAQPEAASARYLFAGDRIVGYAILDSICGGLFLVCLAAFFFGINAIPSWRHFLAGLVVLSSATTWIFLKHIEFYAPLYAALAFFYWRALIYFNERSNRNFFCLCAAVFIAGSMHRVALFQMPALMLVFYDPVVSRRFRWPTNYKRGTLAGFALAAALLQMVPVYLSAIGRGPFTILEDYNWLPELLTPWTQSWADYVREHSKLGSFHIYTFGSVKHWKHFFFFIGVGSSLAVPVIAIFFRRIKTDLEKFLALAATCGWLWALVWHPHLSYSDWDLFCNPAVPTNLLAAALLLKKENGSVESRASGK